MVSSPMMDSRSHHAAIDVSALTKRYQPSFVMPWGRGAGNESIEALSNVSLRVGSGQVYGLLGPNGAGKTTLLRLLTTAIAPSAGTALVAGWDIRDHAQEVRRQIGFVSQQTEIYRRLTPRETLHFFGALYDMNESEIERRVGELSEHLDLTTFIDRPNGTLSAGVRQRVSIARSLLHEPRVWILDEPTTGLDVPTADAVLRLIEIQSKRSAVIFSTHHLWEVERLCGRIGILFRGQLIFEGTVEEMRIGAGQTSLEQAFLTLLDIHSRQAQSRECEKYGAA